MKTKTKSPRTFNALQNAEAMISALQSVTEDINEVIDSVIWQQMHDDLQALPKKHQRALNKALNALEEARMELENECDVADRWLSDNSDKFQ